MYTLIIIFYVSIVGMAIMLLLKWREVTTGHQSLVSRFGQGTDHIFSACFSFIKHSATYMNRHTFIALAQWTAFYILVPIRGVYVELKHLALINTHSKKVIDMVRGKGEIKNHGASFYLKRLSDDKK